MLQRWIFVATVLIAGCPSKQPEAPRPVEPKDTALRIRVANAEVKRAAGLAELKELATGTDVHARELALRGLGRTGGAEAIAILEAALGDPEPKVVIAAATALGVLASLDEEAAIDSQKLVALFQHPVADVRLAAVEAIGRAGVAADQTALRSCASTVGACALALGRFGRRKITIEDATRDVLVSATAAQDRELRYAATYALVRQHEPIVNAEANAALAARIGDTDAEVRALGIAGLAKRKSVGLFKEPIAAALRDPDWRVAVEAARALANDNVKGITLVATSLTGRSPHVVHEALRAMAGKTLEPEAITAITPLVKEPGWTGCLAAAAIGGPNVVDAITSCQLADHLKLPLLAEVSDLAAKRAGLRVLLAHDDPRVRGAGLGALASTWKDSDAKTRQTIVSTMTSSLAAPNAIVAGQATEAVSNILETGVDPTQQAALATAIVTRAATETDAELAGSLFGVIEKHKITSGLDACRKGLTGHPASAKAAAKCLRALGEAPTTTPGAPPPPPADIAQVINKRVTWLLATNKGTIEIELRPDVAPWAVASIVALTTAKKYDDIEFHRVVPNFVVQGGDPTSSGWGGPGYTLPAEPSGAADGAGFVTGGLGMADAGPDSAGSQWFIMHSRAAHLDGRYTWIGRVVSGQAVADSLVIGDKVERATVRIE